MSETKHTLTPWRVNDDEADELFVEGAPGSIRNPRRNDGPLDRRIVIVTQRVAPPEKDDDEERANIDRIIACVNACEGICSEALKGGLVFQLVDVAKDALRVIEDEYGYDDEQDGTQGRLRLLIAKVEGGGE